MQKKYFDFETKNVDLEQRIIEGYASTFGNVDLGGDAVAKGAFTKSIEERLPKNQIKVLWQHWEPIGKVIEAREDERGLWVKCKISKTQLGDEALALAADGVITSFSIGYETIQSDSDSIPGVRILKELKLFEVSLVTFPMNEDAIITAMKSATDAFAANGSNLRNPQLVKSLHQAAAMMQAAASRVIDSKGVSPFQDFEVNADAGEFKEAEVIDRLKVWALGDSGTVDIAKYKTAFLLENADAPDELASYTVPIADVVEGKLVVTATTLKAASDFLQSGSIADDDNGGARAHLEQYFEKMTTSFGDEAIRAPWGQFEEPKSTDPSGKKEGRVLSTKNVAAIEIIRDNMKQMLSDIEALIEDAQPLAGTDDDNEPQKSKEEVEAETKSLIEHIKQTVEQG